MYPAHCRAIGSQSRELPHMSDAITPEVFQVLIERTGLKLTPTQFNELRGAYSKLMSLAARLKTPRDVSAEPASTFSAKV